MDIKIKICTGFLGKKIPFLRKQSPPLQGDHKTNLDLRHRVMGLL